MVNIRTCHFHGPVILVFCALTVLSAPGANADPPSKKDAAELARLEKLYAAAQRDAAYFKGKIDALKAKMGEPSKPDRGDKAEEKPAEGKPYTSIGQLLSDLPKDKYPQPGEDGAPERNAANTWLKDNLVGKTVQWPLTVNRVILSDLGGQGRYDVKIGFQETPLKVGRITEVPVNLRVRLDSGIAWGQVKIGAQTAYALVTDPFSQTQDGAFVDLNVDEAMAKRLRDLKGDTVAVKGVISGAAFYYGQTELRGFQPVHRAQTVLVIGLGCDVLSIGDVKLR
jgi:hypothetical protein